MASMLPAVVGAAALVNQARGGRQDLSGAVNGQIRGANGNMQDLGLAAMRRLGGAGGGGQSPPIMQVPPNIGSTPGGMSPGYKAPPGYEGMAPPPGVHPWGPEGLQGGPPPVDNVISQEPMYRPTDTPSPVSPVPIAGGVNQAGDGPGPNTFNLPGFKPAGSPGNLTPAGGPYTTAGADPNAMRQALGASPAMMNNLDKTPDVATSPFGQSPGSPYAGAPMGAGGGLPPGLGKVPPQGPSDAAGAAGASMTMMRPGVRSSGSGGAGTPWAPPGADGGKGGGGFQLRGFKPKPKRPDQGAPTEEKQPGTSTGMRQGRQNMKPSMGQF